MFVNQGPVLATLNTANASSTNEVINSTPAGDLTIEVTIPAGTTTLVPGSDYVDSLFIDVDPNP
jgi:hypothetical protein